jgi:hypothetical protein
MFQFFPHSLARLMAVTGSASTQSHQEAIQCSPQPILLSCPKPLEPFIACEAETAHIAGKGEQVAVNAK